MTLVGHLLSTYTQQIRRETCSINMHINNMFIFDSFVDSKSHNTAPSEELYSINIDDSRVRMCLKNVSTQWHDHSRVYRA